MKSYNAIFNEQHDPRDVTQLQTRQIREHDLLCAGFPCQSFSIAGSRGGFEDTRGTLFFEIVRIAKAKRPKLLFLENVRGLFSHNEGKTFGKVLKSLNEIGYYVDFRLLNSKHWGVPQNRERIFFLGVDIKWAIKNHQDKTNTGQNKKNSSLEKIIESFLLESLLKNSEEQRKLHETRLKEWGLDYLILTEAKRIFGENEIYGQKNKYSFLKKIIPKELIERLQPKSEGQQTQLPLKGLNSDSENTKNQTEKEDTSTVTDTLKPMTEEEIDDSIIKWLRKICLEENSEKKKKSTTSISIKPIIEKETFTSAEMGAIILGFIIRQRNSWESWCEKASLNLIRTRANTDYAKRRETDGIKASFNLRRDFYSLEIQPGKGREGVESFGYFGGEPGRKVFPITREDRGDNGEDGGQNLDTVHPNRPELGQADRVYESDGLLPALNGGWTPQIEAKGLNTAEDGSAYTIDASYFKGTSPGDIGSGRRTQVLEHRGHKDKPVKQLEDVPTLRGESHGHQPKVLDETYGFDEIREYTENFPNLRSKRQGLKIVQIPRGQKAGGFHADSPTVSRNIWQENNFLKQVEPVHTPEFAEKDMNMKSSVGSSDGSMFTLTSSTQHGIKENKRIRKLTPRECWRLQGFPDSSFEKAQEVNSDTQLYKQAGNAVTVNVVEDIGERLVKYFEDLGKKGGEK